MLDEFFEPHMLPWSRLVSHDDDSGLDVFIPQTANQSSDPAARGTASSDEDPEQYVLVGTLTAELLRLGVHRILSGLTPTPADTRFIIQASEPDELNTATLDAIAQAALWGELRF